MKHIRKTRLLAAALTFFLLAPCTAWAAPVSTETPQQIQSVNTTKSAAAKKGKWITQNGRLWYRNANGSYTKNDFQKINGNWYFFDKNGWLVTGWKRIGRNWYYLAKSGNAGTKGKVMTGWRTIGGETYYLRTTGGKKVIGRMASGWRTLGKNTYYFDNSGALETGLTKVGKLYFYFTQTGANGTKGKMLTGWRTLGGKKYYFRPSGDLGVKGSRVQGMWKTIGNVRYYFDKNGVCQPKDMDEQEFIAYIGPLATKDMKKSGILASVTTAQAILESGYGTTTLATEANNLFGMKASLSGNTWGSAWDGRIYKKETWEYDETTGKTYTIIAEFRRYDSYSESLADHSAYLRGAKNGSKLRYRGVIGNKDYEETARIIKNGGYATDPAYVTKLCDIIERFDLTQYDK